VIDGGRFGNRFNDSEGRFRVLHAGSAPPVCFVETLARCRKPQRRRPDDRAQQHKNTADEQMPFGRVPPSWVGKRTQGEAACTRKRFAHLYASEWPSYLRRTLEPGLMAKRLDASWDFDLALLGSQD
jgi:hypothetical protein